MQNSLTQSRGPDAMISDGQKLGLLAVASLLGVFVGFRVTNNLNSQDAHLQATRAVDQRLHGATGVTVIGEQSPKWQLVIEKVSTFHAHTCLPQDRRDQIGQQLART